MNSLMPSALQTRILAADPGADYHAHRDVIDEAVHRVLESGWYVLGQEVAAFEQEFADYLGIGHAIGVGSGTEALHLALRVLGIGPGDSVITVSHTAVATVAAIGLAGATPRFVDIEPGTFTMDPHNLTEVIERELCNGAKVRAVIPVHLYGHPAAMPAIMEVAKVYQLAVIEDCAQAHGARIDGRMAGTWGEMAAFSFYPTKNLGAIGDGGAVVTADAELAEKARWMRQYGWKDRNCSEMPGMNTRLDEVQAGILRAKLPWLERANQRRRELAAYYDKLLGGTPLRLPRTARGARHVFHQYVVRTQGRDQLLEYLHAQGVFAAIHYPVPVHRQAAYAGVLRVGQELPVTDRVTREILSLPLHPGVSKRDAAYIADLLIQWYRSTPYSS